MTLFDPTINKIINIGTKQYVLNQRNYLKNISEWDDQLRDWLALQEKIVLGPEHLHALVFLREVFALNKIHPVIRTITAELGKQYGQDRGTIKYFHKLFPGGIHQAFLIAGIPMQDSCC